MKLINGGGLESEFTVTTMDGSITLPVDQKHKNARDPHPDMTKILDGMLPLLAESLRMKDMLIVGRSKKYKATDAQLKALNRTWEEVLDSMDVTGVSVSGKDDNRGIVIKGEMKTGNGRVVAMNSPRIQFSANTYGFEEALEEMVEELETETWAYTYHGKGAQLEMFAEEQTDQKMAAANDA